MAELAPLESHSLTSGYVHFSKCYILEKNKHRCELRIKLTILQLVNRTSTEPTREILCIASSLRVIMTVGELSGTSLNKVPTR